MHLDYKMIGKRIRSARKDAQMTQDTLALKCDCTSKYISAIESGRKSPSLDLLTQISSALDVTVNSLLVDSPLACPKYYVDAVVKQKIASLSVPYLVTLNEVLDSLLKLQAATKHSDNTLQ